MEPSSGDDGNLEITGEKDSAGRWLQWGRRLVTTEMADDVNYRNTLAAASMGPSSGDDGNVVTPAVKISAGTLQWGRRLVTTEISGVAP